jgi:hypothetical protein
MIHARAEIAGARLKAEVVKEKGEVVDTNTFWLVTLKIPAGKVDANAIAHWAEVSQTVDVVIDSTQVELDLTSVTVQAA